MPSRFSTPFPASAPRQVEGGIRAKSTRGRISNTWWSSRFIELLEDMGMGGRLTRGRNYARRGQVVSLTLDAGTVTASVQGSRARPYRVRIQIAAYGKDVWAQIEERLASDAWFVAQLLAGEMPADIEGVFTQLGLALFPSAKHDLALDCSCPDWEVPCKHLAAVFYLLAERFDEDPFDILAWRGRDRDELLARLGVLSRQSEEAAPVRPLPESVDLFYAAGPAPMPGGGRAGAPPSPPEGFPPVDLVVRKAPLAQALQPAYERLVAARGDEAGQAQGPKNRM